MAEFAIPKALYPYASLPLWVVWRWQEDERGRPTKVLYQPEHPEIRASSTKSATWSDADTAIAVAESDGFDGIGFCLHEGEVAAFDLDHCRDEATGRIHPWVDALIKRANSYTEITPSKTGLRIIGIYCGELKRGIKRPVPGAANGESIEAYPASPRYITVTGDHLDDTPEELADITAVMDSAVEELTANAKTKASDDDDDDDDDDVELPPSLTTRLFIADEGAGKVHAGYGSRSELMFAFIADALRAGIAAETIVRSCLDPSHRGHAIYEHCTKNGGEGYVERQIDQARAKIKTELDDHVAKVNEDHAFILVGNKAAVMKFEKIGGRITFRLLQVGAFKLWFSNRQVMVGRRVMSVAEYWLSHSQRREYHGIEFAPAKERSGYYNLWRGFAVEPRAGDCSKFLAHIRDNVARSDEHFKWIMAWWANIVQRPTEKPGTALVIRGKQGTGKTKVGEVFGSLFGEHYELVADQRYVTGQFNSHMASLVVLHADEAFWAGDRRAEGKLKDLVTGMKHRLEFKGIEPIMVDNFIRLFVTANHDWVIPAGFDERRFATFDIGEDRVRDYGYFAAIDHEMNNGGREALLHHLLNLDTSKVNLREIPRTSALLEQIVDTATPEQAWWFDTLTNGMLPYGCKEEEKNTCPKWTLYRRYISHAKLRGINRRQIEVKLGMFLKRCVGPELNGERKQEYFIVNRHGNTMAQHSYVYTFPALRVCRERFGKLIGQEVLWNDPEAEWQIEDRAIAEQSDEPI